MKSIDDIIRFLKSYDAQDITLMEVCGTHTASIVENAIPSLISSKIHLVSGPGCPVCVTVSEYVDKLVSLAASDKTIVTFGDMIRVPGSETTLRDIKAQGADIRMVYSPMETIELAKTEPDREFVFAAVGFETTTPIYAVLIDEAMRQGIKNLKLLTALKTMPEVIRTLCRRDNRIDGFIAPGHVAAITGSNAFAPIAKEFNVPFAVSGFRTEEILSGIYALVKMRERGEVINLYKSVVRDNKNEAACELVGKYFEPCSAAWRGLGMIEQSGMAVREEYSRFDAGSRALIHDYSYQKGCCCGEIIAGIKKPSDCPLYSNICNPENPCGACMVSSEGSCYNHIMNRNS